MNSLQKRGRFSTNLSPEVTQHCSIDCRGYNEIFHEPIKRKWRIGAERVLGDYKDIIKAPPPRFIGRILREEAPTDLQSSWLAELNDIVDENISELEGIVAEMTEEARKIGGKIFKGNEAIFGQNNHAEGLETRQSAACRAAAIQNAYQKDKELVIKSIIDPEEDWQHQETKEGILERIQESEGYSLCMPPSIVPDLSSPCSTNEETSLLRPFTPEEVCQTLKMEKFCGAGMDGLKASSWSKADPGGIVLSEVFNRCLRLGKVPFSWKNRRIILVRNEGDSNPYDRWRPLFVLPMIAKIYAGCISNRVSAWARMGKRVSYPFQKGLDFSNQKLAEHAFLIQAVVEDAWRNQKEVALAWLKTEESFCSINFKKILGTLHLLGMPDKMLKVVEDFYSVDQKFVSHGCTQLGYRRVNQGCPLYSVLFILSMEPVIRAAMVKRAVAAYRLGTQSICILAHAGDMVLVARNSGMLRSLLWSVGKTADWISISFTASKCASLHLHRMKAVTSSTFKIQGNDIQPLYQGEFYNFLGFPMGFRVKQISMTAEISFLKDLYALDASRLMPWQKLNALRVSLIPQFETYIRSYKVMKKYIVVIDKKICEVIRSWMYLPQRSSKEVIYLPPSLGGAGCLPFRFSSDLLFIELGFHLLTSEDPLLRISAMESLQDVVHRKTGRRKKPPSESILCKYLNGNSSGRLGVDVGDASSTWSLVRKATRCAKSYLRIKWGWDNAVKKIFLKVSALGSNVKAVKVSQSTRSGIYKILKRAAGESFLKKLIAKPDQGKVYELSSLSSVSNHFLHSGRYIRFCDWRFIHSARLNVLPLYAALRGRARNETKCRWCYSAEETLPHVLSHCPARKKVINMRHDTIVDLFVSSLPSKWDVTVNQTVAGLNSSLRPDLLIRESREGPIHLLDVVISFIDRPLGFTKARKLKIMKYSSLANSLRHSLGREFQVTLDALVVGSLGSWDQENDSIFERFHITGKKARIIKEKMISLAIKWSRNIYVEHVTGKCQCDGANIRI